MGSNKTGNYYFFISPLHQRLSDFENRFRKWRIFNKRQYPRSSSTEPKPRNLKNPDKPVCFTSPIPRKNMNLDLSSRRPRIPLELMETSISDNELNDRYKVVQEMSGILKINGQLYQDVKVEDLIYMSDLGSGTCGTVSKRKLKARAMAVKEMKRTDNKEESKRIFMDLDVVRKSNDCPYIVQCFGYIITMDHLYICMELMANCLEKVLNQRNYIGLPEEIIGKVAYSVVEALAYLKNVHSLMHRDVKPSNILLDWHGNIKLCDFGISGQLIDSKATTWSTGCTAYLAPERINRLPYNVTADVWSLGITLVQLAKGFFPYTEDPTQSLTPFVLMLKIRDEDPPQIDPNNFSPEFCDFVKSCLLKSNQERPKYDRLSKMPFLIRASQSDVDVGHWMANQDQYDPPFPPRE
ncbi:unnamed protein product [Bursaphelenchus xylophilus]|uniref:mitogen-activated protein kinase kinase n=1 Tax=Bursaphelenchus xylophilus TaxID=6326 RepID=A0A1I7SM61_BURXY|nr:unnamed protein product [Bursaphelenchus xylophilus]CAG9130009.1 unnamed protein product [Bursaphelenchus xylophilus]